jgi:thioredoxin-related protein
MKQFLLMSLLTISVFASSINFEKDLASAKQKAVAENKKLMIMYSTPTCPECNYMKKKVLKNEQIVSYVNENFVSIILDIKEDEEILPYKFIGIPTFYFVNASNMELIGKKIGGTREEQFLEIVKNIK